MSDDLDMRAAEYVLGHQDSAEREAVRREMEVNADLRAAVARWERILLPLAQTAQPIAPSPDLLARIKAGLPLRLESDAVVLALRRSVRRWRAAAVVSAALAASVLVFAGVRLLGDAGKPSGIYVAAVNRGGDAPALIVRVDLASGRVFVRPVSAEAPEGKSLELWYIAAGAAPRSMGLVGQKSENLALPRGAIEKAKFAVTVEPQGGSPSGAPTGPIVYAGELVRE